MISWELVALLLAMLLACIGVGLGCYRMGQSDGQAKAKIRLWGNVAGVTYCGTPIEDIPGFGRAPAGMGFIVVPPLPPMPKRCCTACKTKPRKVGDWLCAACIKKLRYHGHNGPPPPDDWPKPKIPPAPPAPPPLRVEVNTHATPAGWPYKECEPNA